jgi:hypothetical protein
MEEVGSSEVVREWDGAIAVVEGLLTVGVGIAEEEGMVGGEAAEREPRRKS